MEHRPCAANIGALFFSQDFFVPLVALCSIGCKSWKSYLCVVLNIDLPLRGNSLLKVDFF